jgi:hypothetical protein
MGLVSSVRAGISRRRAVRRLLDDLARDLQRRQIRLDDLEGAIDAERDGFHERIVSDVLERSELILAELDRRIADVAARIDRDLGEMERRLVDLHEKLQRLRATKGESGQPTSGQRVSEQGASGNGEGRQGGAAASTTEGAPSTPVAE